MKTNRPFVARARPLTNARLGDIPKPNEKMRVDEDIDRHKLITSVTSEISPSVKRKIWREGNFTGRCSFNNCNGAN
jgi:hypothetical protein